MSWVKLNGGVLFQNSQKFRLPYCAQAMPVDSTELSVALIDLNTLVTNGVFCIPLPLSLRIGNGAMHTAQTSVEVILE